MFVPKVQTAQLVTHAVLLLLSAECLAESRSNEPLIQAAATSFEKARAGQFDKLETPIGTWTPSDGRTIVDAAHARTGKHCLQLTGGAKTAVTLAIADGVETAGDLTFRAERWTKREPFSFRIEKNSGDGWKEIFNGDKAVVVGREFLSRVKVPLRDGSIRQLRFTCTSPPNTGILIDDIRLSKLFPMRVVSVKARHLQSPILLRREVNPVIDVQVEVEGSLNPLTLTRLTALQLGGANVVSTLAVDAWATGTDSTLPSQNIESMRKRASLFDTNQSVRLWFDGKQSLEEGVNHFFVSARLPDDIDLSKRVHLDPGTVTIAGKQIPIETAGESPVTRFGYAVRKANDDGSKSYRIPGLATTNKGTLIGVYDIRRRGSGDLPGDIDVGMSRSTDGGQSWEPMQTIMDMGDDPKWNYDGIGDPAVLVD
jgi:sialidase-1